MSEAILYSPTHVMALRVKYSNDRSSGYPTYWLFKPAMLSYIHEAQTLKVKRHFQNKCVMVTFPYVRPFKSLLIITMTWLLNITWQPTSNISDKTVPLTAIYKCWTVSTPRKQNGDSIARRWIIPVKMSMTEHRRLQASLVQSSSVSYWHMYQQKTNINDLNDTHR